MILFLTDWQKYPTARADLRTKNTSFIEIAKLYKKMGVTNHAWPLALVDQSLVGVDPFSETLTEEQQGRIAQECKINPWYYFREVARVPGRAGGEPVPLRANRGNMALFWLFFNHITTVLIQIRQTGKSLNMDELASYLLNIACKDTQINLLTKDEKLRAENVSRLKTIMDELPYYLSQRTRKDANNTEEITVVRMGNKFKTHLPQPSPKAALNVGRGLTSPIFFIDEFAFLPNIAISLPAALAGGTAVRDIARANGTPYGTILSTTAGKKDDRDGKYAYKIASTSAPWNEAYLDAADPEELERIIRASSPGKSLRVNCTFNHRQLGYTDEWLARAIEDSIGEDLDVDRDFYNVWSDGSQKSPFSNAITSKIRMSELFPLYTDIDPQFGYMTRWYIKESEIQSRLTRDAHVIALDTSEAIGKDDIGMVLRNARTGEVIAAANVNETNLIRFSEWLAGFFIKYERIVGIIERRSTGGMILDYLILQLEANGIDPFKRLYNRVVQEKEEYPERFKEISKPLFLRDKSITDKYRRLFGFSTSGTGYASRSELYSVTLMNAIKLTGDTVRDEMIVKQILGLSIRNGRIDHEEGEHDDMVIAWLLSYWLLSLGKNLSFYGMQGNEVLSMVADISRDSADRELDLQRREQQQSIRKLLDDMADQLRNEKDPIMFMRMESTLRRTASAVTIGDNDTFSVDAMIREIKEKRPQQATRNLLTQSYYQYRR